MYGNSKEELYTHIESLVNKDFDIIYNFNDNNSFPTLTHRKSRLNFKYIPEGEFDMGFSISEEAVAQKICAPIPANIDEMRPVHRVKVKPFLISCLPILNNLARDFFVINNQMDTSPFSPAYLTREQAEYLVKEFGCRLPYEYEWEYACRATTKTLFVFGDNLPEDDELEKWLSWDFSDINKLQANPFGLYGMFIGEWCQDEYRFNYNLNSPIDSGSYVIRGGGSLFWPWQAEEWVWCMSAMRMSSKDTIDGTCGLRLVFNLSS
jgi:formylglycine-generating enzyme required for sulfatase activity